MPPALGGIPVAVRPFKAPSEQIGPVAAIGFALRGCTE
jgi:hypothetical protein